MQAFPFRLILGASILFHILSDIFLSVKDANYIKLLFRFVFSCCIVELFTISYCYDPPQLSLVSFCEKRFG